MTLEQISALANELGTSIAHLIGATHRSGQVGQAWEMASTVSGRSLNYVEYLETFIW